MWSPIAPSSHAIGFLNSYQTSRRAMISSFVLICFLLIAYEFEHLFPQSLAIWISSPVNWLFTAFTHLFIWLPLLNDSWKLFINFRYWGFSLICALYIMSQLVVSLSILFTVPFVIHKLCLKKHSVQSSKVLNFCFSNLVCESIDYCVQCVECEI